MSFSIGQEAQTESGAWDLPPQDSWGLFLQIQQWNTPAATTPGKEGGD